MLKYCTEWEPQTVNWSCALERRVAYLESQLKVVRQQPLTMQQLYERRQEKLDYYRQQYEGPRYVREDAQDEIDSVGK